MAESDNIVVETATRIFRDLCDPQTINNAADDAWKAPLWSALEESGLTLAWVSDEVGGAGASIADGFEVLRVSGRFAVPVPLAETLLAGWLLERAGLSVPAAAMTVAPIHSGDRLTLSGDGRLVGTARHVPFASAVDHVVVLAHRGTTPVAALVDRDRLAIKDGETIAGDTRGTITFDGVVPAAVADLAGGIDGEAFMLMGAAVRAAQMAGALEAALDLTVGYSMDRQAFGRPIAKFQAVQHNLARLAGEVAAAVAAAGSAADTLQDAVSFDEAVFLEASAAKIRVGEAAGEGAAIAHQVHGAIGFTREHVLHRFTRRLWSWRDEFGSEAEWAVKLGQRVAANGADALWPMVSAR